MNSKSIIYPLLLLLLNACSVTTKPSDLRCLDYIDAGSLGTISWNITSNEYYRATIAADSYIEEMFRINPDYVTSTNITINYEKRMKSFIQKYGDERIKYIAIQYIPKRNDINIKPFTIYYNANSNSVGRDLNLPAIMYSPGPPYSFHPKGVYGTEGVRPDNRE